MKRLLILLVALSFSTVALAKKPTSRPAKKPWAPRKDCSGVYGIQGKSAGATVVALDKLFKSPKKYEGKLLNVAGVVKDVCHKKGCWLLLGARNKIMRVRFKGYKFFVPTNSKGYGVRVFGFAKLTTIPEKLARHYALESGKPEDAKKIKGPQKSVVFTANWVEMYKLKK